MSGARGMKHWHDAEAFDEHRGLLFTVAYEMLGAVADAEDVLSETWLRWDVVTGTRWSTTGRTW